MIRTIHFHSILADKAEVKTIDLDCDTPRAMISALMSQVKKFRALISEYPAMNLVASNSDKTYIEPIGPDEFEFTFSEKATDIHLLTDVEGSGAEMIAYFIMEMNMSLAMATAVTSIITNVAISVVLGAVSAALAPSPSTSGGNPADTRPSFLFNGAVNVTEQGYPVPLIYGIHTSGSIVISAGVDVSELPYESEQAAAPANGGGTTQPAIPPVQPDQWAGITGNFHK